MEIDYFKNINGLLQEHLTPDAKTLWKDIIEKTPMVMHRPSSSSGKYHLGDNGKPRTIAEHTYQILFAALNLLRMFDIKTPSRSADSILLAAACHDILKYGCDDPLHRKHTDKRHDKLIADVLLFNKDRCLKALCESEFNKFEQICRYHSGRWSTDADNQFNFKKLPVEVMFIHILDMLSSQNLLNIPRVEYVSSENDSST